MDGFAGDIDGITDVISEAGTSDGGGGIEEDNIEFWPRFFSGKDIFEDHGVVFGVTALEIFDDGFADSEVLGGDFFVFEILVGARFTDAGGAHQRDFIDVAAA